jgi:hypothetical protein
MWYAWDTVSEFLQCALQNPSVVIQFAHELDQGQVRIHNLLLLHTVAVVGSFFLFEFAKDSLRSCTAHIDTLTHTDTEHGNG